MIGNMLIEIKERELYTERDYKTFEEYLAGGLTLPRPNAYRYMRLSREFSATAVRLVGPVYTESVGGAICLSFEMTDESLTYKNANGDPHAEIDVMTGEAVCPADANSYALPDQTQCDGPTTTLGTEAGCLKAFRAQPMRPRPGVSGAVIT